jgi:hypothetical protein
MKQHKKILIVSLSVLVLTLALACGGGGTPVPMSDIPIYDGATSTAAGDAPLVDLVVQSMEDAVAGENITMETKTYALPDGATWSDVKGFYNDKLEGTDWKPAAELSDESVEEFKTIGWQRGPASSEQLLVVAYLPDLFGESATLIIMLFSE